MFKEQSSSEVGNSSTTSSSEEIAEEINETNSDTDATRGVIGDIQKLKKIGELLETVGEKVIPALVEVQTQKSLISSAASSVVAGATSDTQTKGPFAGLKLLHAFNNRQQEGNTNENVASV